MAGENYLIKEVTRLRGDKSEAVEDTVIVEVPVTLFLNGNELVTLLCTPGNLDKLALGFLRSEGLLNGINEVESLRVEEEQGHIHVELKRGENLVEKLYGKRTITSGCGKGSVFFSVLDSLRSKPITGDLIVDSSLVLKLMDELQDRADLFKTTGGVHSAALADKEGIIFFSEDIGRHNAVDKIIGETIVQEIATDDKIIITSGRLSSEILLKVVKLGIQMLISRSAPTSLCVELADNLNVTLVGFVRGKRMNIYSHRWRINY